MAANTLARKLRERGLTYPGAHSKSPWPGHDDLAVNDKTFAYLSSDGEPFSVSFKLPQSQGAVLMLPFAQPTPYGLGKSGWVSLQPKKGQEPPLELLVQWLDESYRAQAPKKLVAKWELERGAPPVPKKSAAKPKKPAKKAARK